MSLVVTSNILLSIAPVFLLIVLGYGLRRSGFPSAEFWNVSNKFVYWIVYEKLLRNGAA